MSDRPGKSITAACGADRVNLKNRFPFRLGTTSFILAAGIMENIPYLAGLVDDVELLLFESDAISEIPSQAEVARLAGLARENHLTYTVHLPLDLWLGADEDAVRISSVGKVRRIVNRLEPLHPFAYICHLHGDRPGPVPSKDMKRWAGQCRKSLEEISRLVSPDRICVETLDYPFSLAADLVCDLDLSICLDVGHCNLFGYPFQEIMKAHGRRIRVLHLHGVDNGKDHRSLKHLEPDDLSFILAWLGESSGIKRVLTMEVFGQDKFLDSLEAMAPYLAT